ncbi:phage holin family protein [Candidatus Roizmanbacteria bacterium]|nr:phage holin family protein [Candidatus Roizmanbacteria bacterium]
MVMIANLLLSALAVFITSYLLPGVRVDNFLSALTVAIVLGVVNAIVKPILTILTLPITLLTLGLFTFVINALIILFVSSLVRGFAVDGFLAALLFSLVLSIVNSVLHALTK